MDFSLDVNSAGLHASHQSVLGQLNSTLMKYVCSSECLGYVRRSCTGRDDDAHLICATLSLQTNRFSKSYLFLHSIVSFAGNRTSHEDPSYSDLSYVKHIHSCHFNTAEWQCSVPSPTQVCFERIVIWNTVSVCLALEGGKKKYFFLTLGNCPNVLDASDPSSKRSLCPYTWLSYNPSWSRYNIELSKLVLLRGLIVLMHFTNWRRGLGETIVVMFILCQKIL